MPNFPQQKEYPRSGSLGSFPHRLISPLLSSSVHSLTILTCTIYYWEYKVDCFNFLALPMVVVVPMTHFWANSLGSERLGETQWKEPAGARIAQSAATAWLRDGGMKQLFTARPARGILACIPARGFKNIAWFKTTTNSFWMQLNIGSIWWTLVLH